MDGEPVPDRGGAYDYDGPVAWEYRPEIDGEPDPGEIVWSWVAFEDEPSIGKDRPVAVVGRAIDGRLVALMLSSRNHDGERGWIAIGSGPWDRDGRDSWLRGDRVLAVAAGAVRREGAILPRSTYESVRTALSGTGGPRDDSAGPPASRRGRFRRLFRRS